MMNSDLFRLDGMRILLTGAAGGIGSATAKVCAGLGAEMLLTDRASSSALRDEIVMAGGSASSHLCDVTDRVRVEQLCASLGRVDACILNAGANIWNDWMDDDWNDSFHAMMEINVLGALNFARALLPGMQRLGRGRIIITGSVAGFTGGGSFAAIQPHYVIAKGGLHTFVRWLARHSGGVVQVNGVAPGTVGTSINDDAAFKPPTSQIMQRLATPEEIAGPLAFLCSPAASFMTGAIIDVNGGNYLR